MRRLLPLLALLLAQPAWAQGPVSGTVTDAVQPSSGGTYTSQTFSITVATGTDRCLVVVAIGLKNSGSPAETVTDITFNTTETMTETFEQAFSGGPARGTTAIYTLVAPTETTANVVVTFSGALDSTSAHAIDFTNCHQTTPTGATAGANGNSGSPSTSITTANANSMIVVGIGFRGADGEPFGASNGETELSDGESGTSTSSDISFWVAELFKASAGAQTIGASASAADRWGIVGIELREPAGAATDIMVIQ